MTLNLNSNYTNINVDEWRFITKGKITMSELLINENEQLELSYNYIEQSYRGESDIGLKINPRGYPKEEIVVAKVVDSSENHIVEVIVNLTDFNITTKIDNYAYDQTRYGSLEDMNVYLLENLDTSKYLQAALSEIHDKIHSGFGVFRIDEIRSKNYLSESLTISSAKTLPKGWKWVSYRDGSGSLIAPDGKSFCSYDLQTDEIMFDPSSNYGYSRIFDLHKNYKKVGETYITYHVLSRYLTQSPLYHGSMALFDDFNLDNIGQNGRAQGIGIYLTPDKEVAEVYSEKNQQPGYLYTVKVNLENSLSLDDLTLTRSDISNILETLQDNDETDILSNFGDINYEGFNEIKQKALDLLLQNIDDIDLYNELVNITGNQGAVAQAFYDVGHYTHCIAEEQTRLGGTVVVVLDPRRVEIESVYDYSNEQTIHRLEPIPSSYTVAESKSNKDVSVSLYNDPETNYSVQIEATLSREIILKASSSEEAAELAERMVMSGELVLDKNDLNGVLDIKSERAEALNFYSCDSFKKSEPSKTDLKNRPRKERI